ncbi:hypothetical protein HV824_25315 [Myxococcus sp. AM009]|uniref:hypothetical protein n=1 Tax=unclassified Myxococcus TaxID=2648731 RepID=UPI00159634D6|nr:MULTISPECIES: hypothetical protein [unclassified Myxococcus]NVJ01411.1 hypothetical protein [Myxococcus sp. AM009]NVJ18076.1 hypothetical protein [Myxococcus sp. AM010]
MPQIPGVKSTVSSFKPGPVVAEVADRTMNAVALEANVAKRVGSKGGSSEPVRTPQQAVSTIGSTSGTLNNAINVADTFETGARAIGQMSRGTVPTALPPTFVGKTLGKFVPGLNVVGAMSSLSNTRDVFTNASSTPSQKTHAVIDSASAVVSALPIPGLAQGAAVVNTVNSLFTPSSSQ